MAISKFNTWLETFGQDIYGFDQIVKGTPTPENQDDPIQAFGAGRMMTFLLKKKIGDKIPRQRFDDEVRWGDQTGALRIKITPNGNIVVGRQINDLDGNLTWICKRVYKINDQDFAGHEDSLAHDIIKKIEDVAKEPVDTAIRDWKDLYGFVSKIAKDIKGTIPGLFIYEDIKEINKSNYIIYFSLRGTGQGKIVRRRMRAGYTPFLDIDISYDKDTGLIRIILTTTTIDGEGSDWEIDIPYLDEKFTPTQNPDEIIKAISTTIRYY